MEAQSKTERRSKERGKWKEARKRFRFIRLPEVQDMTGLSKARIYVLMREGKFPQAYKLGERAVGWRDCDIIEWQYNRQAA